MPAQTERVEQGARLVVTPFMLTAMRQGESDRQWLEAHPEVLEPYRGEWVAVHKGRIVAHSPDGRALARQGGARVYPGVLVFYVPTREEAEAVRILQQR